MNDVYGDLIDVQAGQGDVLLTFSEPDHSDCLITMRLDPAKQEEFAQLYVAACHQAKVNAAQAVPR